MSNKDLVSIIIPCYNGEKFISRSIESVYLQTYSNIELIVVDDGSTDESKSIILQWTNKFEKRGQKLKYLYQRNGGVGSAINYALKEVAGSFLLLLDADDRLLPDSILAQVSYLCKNMETGAVRTNGWLIRGEEKWLFSQKGEEIPENLFELMLEGTAYNWAGSYMVRTDILWNWYPKREIYPSRLGQNLQILLPVIYNMKCGFIDEPLMEYIQQDCSLSRSTAIHDISADIHKIDGYFDIRRFILKNVLPSEEANKYLNLVQRALVRSKMKLAIEYGDKSLIKEFYSELCQYGKPTLDDRIIYYQQRNKIIALILRIWRKVSYVGCV